MGDEQRSLNPAASKSRMYFALALLLGLGVLAWLTIDASAVVHVPAYTSRLLSYEEQDVPLRWLPIVVLGLIAFKVFIANMRASLEEKKLQEG